MFHPLSHTARSILWRPARRTFHSTRVVRCPESHPSDRPTYYDLFPHSLPAGPPPAGTFSIDARALRREFLQLQAVAHPDRHAAARKTLAQAESAQINEAYKTLLDPLRRAQYLLSLHAIDVTSEELAGVDHELLSQVMELQEAVDEAENEQCLEALRQTNQQRMHQSEELLEEYFRRSDFTAAKSEVIKLKYWKRIQDSIDSRTDP
ncbi:hypothetical protein K3495_g8305 [Podosphaera aphanis]|nr:hypothetical protein K3495_g8305 [Podosphaera aphanis]